MLEGRVDARFESLEGRMDAWFESFEDRMDARFERMDARFDRIEDRFLALDGRFETFEHKILGTMEHDFARLTMRLFAIYGATVCAMLGAVVALVKL